MPVKSSLRNLPSQIIWRMPMRFRIANLLGSRYALRCVLFHHIAAEDSPFTKGLGITLGVEDFDAKMRFLAEHYSPMSLEDVLALPTGKRLPRRPVLLTFDDAYASVAEVAGPICRKYGIPATFFVNASLVGPVRLKVNVPVSTPPSLAIASVASTVITRGTSTIVIVASAFAPST